MATSKAPKHDFAPAWLKIPSQDNAKPSGRKQYDYKVGHSSQDDRYRHHQYDGHLPRQRSFDSYEDRRFGSSKHRHNSLDDDYYSQGYALYGYYGYGFDKYGNHYRSQPMLYRPGPGRDGKYPPPPNSRYAQMNGNYHPYYEYYDFYPGDSYYNGYPRNGGGRPQRDYDHKSKDNKDKQPNKDEKEKKNLDDDFPTLNGDKDSSSDASKQSSKSHNGGVWEHPPKVQTSSGKQTSGSNQNSPDSQRKEERGIYKALIPNKVNRKTNNKNGTGKDSSKPPTPTNSNRKDSANKENSAGMEVLNTRYVTLPKSSGDKKTDFIKSLKKDNSRGNRDINSNERDGAEAGGYDKRPDESELPEAVNRLRIDRDSSLLSSSLEAEKRLLHEMGWNEDEEEEEYVITEDDMKHFHDLSNKFKSQRSNGLSKPALPSTWSPKHLQFPPPTAEDLNETLSSSDSDLDMD